MTITNREERARFWGTRPDGEFSGGTLNDPFRRHVEIFRDKQVLEIGPGAGREFLALSQLAKSYAVADISKEVLEKPVYENVPKFVIESYEDDVSSRFDVITFWYVIHHVKLDETESFLRFVHRHLVVGGHVYFNTVDDTHPDAQANDGIGTTAHPVENILKMLVDIGFVVKDVEHQDYSSVCVLAIKAS